MTRPIDLLLIDDEDDLLPGTKPGEREAFISEDSAFLMNMGIYAARWGLEPPKLAVPLLSAQAKAAGHAVEAIYRPFLPWKRRLLRELLEHRPRVVAITTVAMFDPRFVARLTREARRLSPGSIIVLGGHGATNSAAIRALGDLHITGHGEWALTALLNELKAGKTLDQAAGVRPSEEGGRVLDGCLRYEGIPRVLYPDWSATSTASRRYPVEASRGCRFNCAFCGFPGRGGQVFRPAEEVVGEMLAARRQRGIRRFDFVDSSLTSDPDYILGLCAGIRRAGLKADWKCFARPDAFDRAPELAREMAAAGCSRVFMGVESVHDHILSGMRRGMDRAAVERGLDRVFKAGIKVHGNFIIGFPGETRETVRGTVDFIAARPFSSVLLCTFGMSQEMKELAAREPERYEHLEGRPVKGWRHDGMDYKTAYQLTLWAVRKVNLSKLWLTAASPATNSPDLPPF
jgi:p-methyltransferase